MINFTENNSEGMVILTEVEKQLQDYQKLYLDAARKSWTRSRVGKGRSQEYYEKAYQIGHTLKKLREFRNDWLEANQ